MNLFFFKRKEIVIDCFTSSQSVFDFAKPQRSAYFVPDWWKQLPKTRNIDFVERATMKFCVGFLNVYKYGFIAPMWSDFSIHFFQNGSHKWEFSDGVSGAHQHQQWQRGSFMPNMVNIKLMSPWRMKEKTGVSFYTAGCFWNQKDIDFPVVPPGIFDFKYQSANHVIFLFNAVNQEKTYLIKYGTPLVQYVPMSQNKIKLKHHLVDVAEFQRIHEHNTSITFVNKYKTIKAIKNKNG